MKKFISYLAIFFLGISCCAAQDASKIVSDFIKKTGLSNHRNETLRLDMTIESQGSSVPMILSFSPNRKNMRLEMTVQETDVAMVINENEGWIESGVQAQPLPADFIASTRSLTFVASISELLPGCGFSLKNVNQSEYIISVKPSGDVGQMEVTFNKESGMISKVVTLGTSSATLLFSDYKSFSDVMMPSRICAESNAQSPATTFIISNIAFGVKLPDWYFQKNEFYNTDSE